MNRRGTNPITAARAFSLLELTLVLAIIGILMAVAAYSIFGQGEKAREKATWATMNVVKTAIQQYQLNTASYPGDLTALQAGKTPYLEPTKKLVDGWNNPLIYQTPGHDGQPFDLFSKGADGALGTPDDISIWKPPAAQ